MEFNLSRNRLILVSLALFGVLVFSFSVAKDDRGTSEDRPNIVMVSLESTPSYKLPCYGYERNTTPVLCDFAENATLYENAYTPGSYTALSMSAVAGGRYPYRIGVTDEYSKIKLEYDTLAEKLDGAGYRTFSMGYNAIPVYNQLQGYQSNLRSFNRRNHVYRVLSDSEKPVFVRIHVWNTHGYMDRSAMKQMEYSTDNYTYRYIDGLRENSSEWNDTYIWNAYDERLRMADRARVGRVIDEVRASGEFDDTMMVFFSDHGELLAKVDGEYGHERGGASDHLIKVPLIVRYPGQDEGGRVEKLVSTLDLYPTVLDVAGVGYKEEKLDGISLLSSRGHDAVLVSTIRKGVNAVTRDYKLYRCQRRSAVEGCTSGKNLLWEKSNGSWMRAEDEEVEKRLRGLVDNYLQSLESTELVKDRKARLEQRLEELGYR